MLPPADDVADSATEASRAARLTRVMGEVRQYMVFRVWQVGSEPGVRVDVISHLPMLVRIVDSIEKAGILPDGFMERMIVDTSVVNAEALRGQIVSSAKAVLLAHLAPLLSQADLVRSPMLVNNLHDSVCLLFEFALALRLEFVMRQNSALSDPDTGRKRKLIRPSFVGNDGQVIDVVVPYKRRRPEVVLEEALAEKAVVLERLAWARRRIALARKAAKAVSVASGGDVSAEATDLFLVPEEKANAIIARWAFVREDLLYPEPPPSSPTPSFDGAV